MMLFAGTFAVAATVYYQTTIILWELAIGGPLLITAALFMLILSGSGRYLAALLALACGAWGYWQLHTYLPLFPEMLEKSWPLFGFLPAATVLAILAAVRCLRSLISPPYVFVAGQAPRRRYAILGILFAYVILGCIAGLSFLPDSVRRPMLRDMWGRYSYDPPTESTPQSVTQTPSPEATPETAQEAKLPEKIQIVQAPGYDLNPVLPPMNSQASTDQPLGSSSYATSVSQVTPPAKKTTRVPTNAREPAPLAKTELTKIAKSPVSSSAALTAPTQPARKVEDGSGQSPATSPILSKGTTGSVKTAATVSPATKKQGPALPVTEPNIMDTALPAFGTPKAYSGLADSLSESPVLNDVSFAETGGQTELSIKSDQKILQRQANPDGTELLRVRYSTELRDIQGRKSQGYLLLDVLMDGKGRVLRSLPVEMSDSETDLFAAMP